MIGQKRQSRISHSSRRAYIYFTCGEVFVINTEAGDESVETLSQRRMPAVLFVPICNGGEVSQSQPYAGSTPRTPLPSLSFSRSPHLPLPALSPSPSPFSLAPL